MLSTVVAVIAVLVLVLPGFIVTELAGRRRATKRRGGDLETILRSLWYSAVLHIVAALVGWTGHIYDDVKDGASWQDHTTALSVYALVVVVVVPTGLGLLLGHYLRTREQSGQLSWFDYALGARDARQGWDYLFGHLDAGYVIVHLKSVPDHVDAADSGNHEGEAARHAPWRTIYGKFGKRSWAAQTPSDRYDLYLEEVWPADATGRILGSFTEPRALWVSTDEIAAMYVVSPPGSAYPAAEEA